MSSAGFLAYTLLIGLLAVILLVMFDDDDGGPYA